MSSKEQVMRDAVKQIVQRKNWKQSDKERFFTDENPHVQFAREFLLRDEVPENLVEAITSDVTSHGYLWCTNKRLFFANAPNKGFFSESESL